MMLGLRQGVKNYAAMNLGHIALVAGQREGALDFFVEAYRNWPVGVDYWDTLRSDYSILMKHGLDLNIFEAIEEEVRKRIH